MDIYPWHIAPLQLSIDALNTATPNLAHLVKPTGRSLSLEKHRCLEYCYTKLGRSIHI